MKDIFAVAEHYKDWGDTPHIKCHIRNGETQLRSFLQKLYHDDARGIFILWTKQDKYTYAIDVTQRDEIVDKAIFLARIKDVYFGVGLQKEIPVKGHRGTAETVSLLPAFWMDIDVKGPHHKNAKLPNLARDASNFLNELEIKPSMVINTGGGVHAYWLFNEPHHISSSNHYKHLEEASKSFQKFIIAEGRKKGWELDDTSDLARLLRMPGTWNWKTIPPKPVYFLEPEDENIYTREPRSIFDIF